MKIIINCQLICQKKALVDGHLHVHLLTYFIQVYCQPREKYVKLPSLGNHTVNILELNFIVYIKDRRKNTAGQTLHKRPCKLWA